jgi:hypothetical protein
VVEKTNSPSAACSGFKVTSVVAEAERMTSLTRLKQLEAARKKNNFKSTLLTAAMTFQVLAVVSVAGAVSVLL